MKKLNLIFTIGFASLLILGILTSCDKNTATDDMPIFQAALDKIELEFANGDSANSVTKRFKMKVGGKDNHNTNQHTGSYGLASSNIFYI